MRRQWRQSPRLPPRNVDEIACRHYTGEMKDGRRKDRAASGVILYHAAIAIRAVWRESFRRTAEGATARKRSGTRTADSRDLWRAIASGDPPKGSSADKRAISQVLRTEGLSTKVLASP